MFAEAIPAAHPTPAATRLRPLDLQARPFLSGSTRRQLKPREHAFFEGDPDSHVYRIESGIVRLYRLLADGRRQIISFKFAGDVIGFESGDVHFCSAEAVSDAVLLCLPAPVAMRRLKEDAGFGLKLVELLSAELADARSQLAVLNRRSAMEKLAAFILDLWRRQTRDGEEALDLKISRSDMADFLGLTIETVSRSLTKLRQQKVIDLPETHRLVVRDMRRLENLATGEVLH